MNIEETQRVNRLAKELLSHGIVSSSQDAYAKAEGMVHGDKPRGQKTLEDNFEKAKAEQTSELQLLKSSLQQLTTDMLRVSSNVRTLAQAFEHLKKEFVTIKAQQAKQEQQPQQQESSQRSRDHNANHNSNVGKCSQGSSDDSRDTQHNTKSLYSQKDVAVDKIFYFGKK